MKQTQCRRMFISGFFRIPVALICVFGLSAGGYCQTPTELHDILTPLIAAHEGEVAVQVRHLETGASFKHQADKVMPTASLIKLPVMIEAYRQISAGMLSPDQLIQLTEEDKVPGSGILTRHFGAGSQLTLQDAIRLMMAYSDNTATNLVIDQIGLPATSETMSRMGFPETKLHARVYRGSESIFPERSRQYGLGSTRAADIVMLLQQLHHQQLATPEYCEAMLEHLKSCESRSKLPRYLPKKVVVAHKTGSVSRSRCDAGIIYSANGPIAVCVLTSENADRRWADDNAADVLIGRIARAVYDHFNPAADEDSTVPTVLKSGAFGRLVESLQRTLNARLDPSPELSVDGDFGSVTESAVVRFQTTRKIEATGVVDEQTWQALSPLVTAPVPVPDPEVVNSEELPLADADDVTGPPFVSCKAWAVADAATGTVLDGANAERPLDIASTTKVMTAYLVLKLAESEPAVLDETVTFSRAADRTRGSTAGIQEGESLPVRELLYGLLLPSGNDAAVALAEHFGPRLTPLAATATGASTESPTESPTDGSTDASADGAADGAADEALDPLSQFVAAMNAAAHELGMENTSFRNPHGLTQDGHQSTAADLVRLAYRALQLPTFRHYISTRQRGCTVIGAAGYTRNVRWKNTNRLLNIDGYSGVKTGTTNRAGACLISLSTRQDRELLLVVLGSASSTGRYVDSRNLFRWAWQQSPPPSETGESSESSDKKASQ
ncbi:MAG: serine hydrolase [Fuerstiella sp.]